MNGWSYPADLRLYIERHIERYRAGAGVAEGGACLLGNRVSPSQRINFDDRDRRAGGVKKK